MSEQPRSGKMRYRLLRDQDFRAVHDVALESWRSAYGSWLTPEFMEERVGATYSPGELRAALEAVDRQEAAFWVALDACTVVGFAYMGDRGEGLELIRLYIHPSYFGEGIGSALLERTEDFVRSKGLATYFCYVHPKNERAMRFYLSRSFYHVRAKDKEQPSLWHMRKGLQ